MRGSHHIDGPLLVQRLRQWAHELGFSQIGIAGIDLHDAEPGLRAWLDAGFHGGMGYMAAHGLKRARPAELVPGTVSVISARMDYLPRTTDGDWRAVEWQGLRDPRRAQVSLYARGRDYHKVLRQRLQQLADRLGAEVGPVGHRVFTDTAPVLEVELAVRAGLGWRGRHTLALSRDAGSMYFLGELFVDLALPPTPPVEARCGECRACLDLCPTRAIVAPHRLDARRCISYLTIEHPGPIAPELRPLIGNRVYGCDDCQLACPWNKYATTATLPDFDVRHGLDRSTLLELWGWTEAEFDRRLQGSAIRRIGWQRWRRNLAVAAGNALRATGDDALRQALRAARDGADALVGEHIDWALAQ
ncbi:MAG: tRNA epoxyqueuosine(34) reductase QueG [Rubrivivax sp.]